MHFRVGVGWSGNCVPGCIISESEVLACQRVDAKTGKNGRKDETRWNGAIMVSKDVDV